MPQIVVLGTHNIKKRAELADLLAGMDVELRTLADFPQALDVIEDGQTFGENAKKKAVQQASHLGEWVLGEDSGICVDALDGRPGVYSARYSGEDATDEANNALLLQELANVPAERRGAYYVCHVTLATPAGEVLADVEKICRGRILTSARGTFGFGYDPLFEIPEYHKTFGELGRATKSVISHRARAMRQLARALPQILLKK